MHYYRHLHKIWEIVKYEYCTVMKFLLLEKQSANNFQNVWQMFTGTVPHRMQPSPDVSLNLNVAEHR